MNSFKNEMEKAGLPSLTVELEREVYDALMAKAKRAESLEYLAHYFVDATWRRVHIGHAMMQLTINVEDETLAQFRNTLYPPTPSEDV